MNDISLQRVLLVENSLDDILLIQRAFKRHRFAVELKVVYDGVEALEYLRTAVKEQQTLPILVIMDLKLPKLDGLEVLYKMRNERAIASLPVVIFTSSNEKQDIATAYKHGVNSFVRKPVAAEDFIDAIYQIGKYWIELNQRSQP